MTLTRYPIDLTAKHSAVIEPLIPPAKPGGRPRTVDIRAVLNAIFYYLKAGYQWRMLPHEFPPWGTVAGYYRNWRRASSAAIIDSQSVKTTEKGGRAAMMPASRKTGVSGTSWWMYSAWWR